MALDNKLKKKLEAFQAPDDLNEAKPEKGDAALTKAGYTGPEERCFSCKNFDGDMNCDLFDAEVSEQGHCNQFEISEGEGNKEGEGEGEEPEQSGEGEEIPEFE